MDVDISTILHGRDFNITNPFLRNAEHCIGKVADAPASPVSKCVSSISVAMADDYSCVLLAGNECMKTDNKNNCFSLFGNEIKM